MTIEKGIFEGLPPCLGIFYNPPEGGRKEAWTIGEAGRVVKEDEEGNLVGEIEFFDGVEGIKQEEVPLEHLSFRIRSS